METLLVFALWCGVWILTLVVPPGSKEIFTAYRINFLHGLTGSVMAILALLGVVDDNVATMTTVSYFMVDFVNILINDFYHRVPSYQSPSARKVEYVHHILCCTVGIMSELMYDQFCTFKRNPFILLMFAEFSTPFLIAWRYTQNTFLGVLFITTFIGCRIVYHGLFLIPDCMRSCHWSVGYGFGVPYDAMNLYFLAMIFRKLWKKPSSKLGGQEGEESGSKTDDKMNSKTKKKA